MPENTEEMYIIIESNHQLINRQHQGWKMPNDITDRHAGDIILITRVKEEERDK